MRISETPSHLNTVLAAVLATSFLMSTTAGYAQGVIRIVNGAPELTEPTTGALLMGTLADGHLVCSATLIGCDVAVTKEPDARRAAPE